MHYNHNYTNFGCVACVGMWIDGSNGELVVADLMESILVYHVSIDV